MESSQEMPTQDQDDSAGDIMESMGEPQEAGDEAVDSTEQAQGGQNTNDPLYVQKRLKQQKRAHEREMREVHARMADLQSRVGNPNQPNIDQGNPYAGSGNSGVDEQIHKAVSYALQQKDLEERKAKQAEHAAHINRQYQDFDKHLDNVSDKYDDFDDVVRGQDVPFTTHMRDASLLLPKTGPGSAGETLYRLGKNPEELSRISKLHPLDQAAEVIRLSHAMIGGNDNKSPQAPRTLGQVKNTPVTSNQSVNEKTPVSSLRAKMRSGTFK